MDLTRFNIMRKTLGIMKLYNIIIFVSTHKVTTGGIYFYFYTYLKLIICINLVKISKKTIQTRDEFITNRFDLVLLKNIYAI